MTVPSWLWVLFGAIVLLSLSVDLVAHRHGQGASRRSAIIWSVVWIISALAFATVVGFVLGADQAEDFVTAYVLEKSLSVDNLFVFLVVFARAQMAAPEQHRVLFWGILGALVFRGIFITAGTAVLASWHEVVYVLGAFLLYLGIKTARAKGTEPKESPILRFLRDRMRLRSAFVLTLVTIELSDIMFAIDSVPAVFAVSQDPFIVYSSNVFAILGLRALYLVVADLLARIRYMQYGLSAILVIAGGKMLTAPFFHVPHIASLLVIVGILAATIAASLVANRRERRHAAQVH